jgi:hypothetical protein
VTTRTNANFTTVATPVDTSAFRILLFAGQDEVYEILKDMTGGAIKNTCRPWWSPVVFVRKKNGDLRLYDDYRKLNDVTKDCFLLPRIGAKWYTTWI